ncbi:MAG TPA: hypothetical protein VI488_00460 [Candidatus Angelobacter sp.]
MTIPQILTDLMQLLFDLAVPAALCTLVLAGMALRQEGGVNFEAGGRFQRWILWSAILLTMPQLLSWFAAQGISLPPQGAGVSSPWLRAMESSFRSFVSDFVLARLVPVLAAFLVLKATLDAAQGKNPLASIIAAMFLLGASSTLQLMQGWNSGSTFATTDLLASLWNYLAGTILPLAAGLAVVGAIINYARHKPFVSMVGAALAFLSVSALWKLVQAMVA